MKERVEVNVGYEGTPIGNGYEVFNRPYDVLDATRHYEQYESDFDLQKFLGITDLRYSMDWDKTFISETEFNFSFYEPILDAIRQRGFNLTLDICHHKTARSIVGSYTHPDFPQILTDYAVAAKNKFPWVKRFVLINEPAVTAWFHANGTWGKFKWHQVYLNMAKAIVTASRALLRIDPEIEFYTPEPIDHDVNASPDDKEIQQWVDFQTEWGRFGMEELLSGKVNSKHGFYHRLLKDGASVDEVEWFLDHRAVPYNRDLDFYQHNLKMHYREDGKHFQVTNPNPPTLASVIGEYRRRMPEMRFNIAETNVRGTVRDRITWFRWVLEQCAEAGIKRLTWWGLFDADTWGDNNFTNRVNMSKDSFPDPVGIYGLEDDDSGHGRLWLRRSNEFSEIVRAYVHGEISVEDIPAYEFTGEYRKELQGYAKHMKHMNLQPADSKSLSFSA